MMKNFKEKNIFLLLIFCCASFAKPDVSFSDSKEYNDAYLKHALNGDNITFILSGNILNFKLPGKSYPLMQLETYIKEAYVFHRPELRDDFLRMFHQSFTTTFTAKEFLTELIRALTGFDNYITGRSSDAGGGCSTGEKKSNMIAVELLFLLIIWRTAFRFLYFGRKILASRTRIIATL